MSGTDDGVGDQEAAWVVVGFQIYFESLTKNVYWLI